MRTASTWSLQIVRISGGCRAGRPLPRVFRGSGKDTCPRAYRPNAPVGICSAEGNGSGRGEVVAVATDRRGLRRDDRGTTDEGAVDVLLRHDRRDVAGLDAAAVEHAYAVGDVPAVELGEQRPDGRADLLRVGGRRHLAGADGPDGLVGDDDGRG